VARDWESWLRTAARAASKTEDEERDRTEQRIRDAIRASTELPSSVWVYVKGSYANNTNVRRDADVDVAIEWTNTAMVMTWGETADMSPAQLGYTPVTPEITPEEFRAGVERALVKAFGAIAVDTSGDKAIDVAASAGTLDADVVPCFQLHRYDAPGVYQVGHRIFPNSGGYVDNYPQQNYGNGVAKNKATGGRYKDIVRCVKRLEGEMLAKRVISKEYPGYLVECLIYNVPNNRFGHLKLYDDMQAVFSFLWTGLREERTYLSWTEVNELLMIFRGRPDRIPANAWRFIDKAWDTIGVA